MLGKFRSKAWQRAGVWTRAAGLILLLVSFFAPLPAAALVATLVAGLALFLVGALAWFAKDSEPWFRS